MPRVHWGTLVVMFGSGIAFGGALSQLGPIATTFVGLLVIGIGAWILRRAGVLPL